MYYLTKGRGNSIRILREPGDDSPLNEPSRDEIARTLVLYHQALMSQLDRLEQEQQEKDRLLREVEALRRELAQAPQRGPLAAAAPAGEQRAAAGTPTGFAKARQQGREKAGSRKLGLFRALIEENKRIREEIENGHAG